MTRMDDLERALKLTLVGDYRALNLLMKAQYPEAVELSPTMTLDSLPTTQTVQTRIPDGTEIVSSGIYGTVEWKDGKLYGGLIRRFWRRCVNRLRGR